MVSGPTCKHSIALSAFTLSQVTPTNRPICQDWVHNIETIDLDQTDNVDGVNNTTNAAGPSAPKIQYIPVPDDGDNTNTVCSICQEKFVTKWLDEAQEWVWIDALRVGGRAFHASCYAEVTKESSGTVPLYGGAARATPDRVLGKRKAEVSSQP